MVKTHILLLFVLFGGALLHGQCYDTIYTNELVTYVETPPIFDGCLAEFIGDNIKYPETARVDSVGGTVVVSFWIDTDGSTFNHKIEKGIRKDLNNEALRVTKLIRYNKPAKQKGKPVKVRFAVPVRFILSDTFLEKFK